jgi:hypothetical protein
MLMKGSHRSSKYFPEISRHIAFLQVFHHEIDLLVKFSIEERAWYFQRSCVCENDQTFCFFLKKIESEQRRINLDEILASGGMQDAGLTDIASGYDLCMVDVDWLVKEAGETIVKVLLKILVKQHASLGFS